MSDPTLAYETPAAFEPSALRTTTWMALLVLGIIYCLGGLCMGGAGAFALSIPDTHRGLSPREMTAVTAIIVGYVVAGLGVGVVYLWTSWRVRHGSKGAAITAMIVALLNAVLLLAGACMGIIVAARDGQTNSGVVSGTLTMAIGGLANGVLATVLILLLRRARRVD